MSALASCLEDHQAPCSCPGHVSGTSQSAEVLTYVCLTEPLGGSGSRGFMFTDFPDTLHTDLHPIGRTTSQLPRETSFSFTELPLESLLFDSGSKKLKQRVMEPSEQLPTCPGAPAPQEEPQPREAQTHDRRATPSLHRERTACTATLLAQQPGTCNRESQGKSRHRWPQHTGRDHPQTL